MLILRHASGCLCLGFWLLSEDNSPEESETEIRKNDANKSSFPAHGKRGRNLACVWQLIKLIECLTICSTIKQSAGKIPSAEQ